MDQTPAASKRKSEAYRSVRLFEEGIGHVIVARYKAGAAMVEAGVFLLDVWCLGVKNAFFARCSVSEYKHRILPSITEQTPLERIEPSCGRKLVENAVQYGLQLGFAPHPDYTKACRVFGGLSVRDCPTAFTFGHEGKPDYIRGPHESEAKANQILEHLLRRCGEGNFHFTMVVGHPPLD